MAPRAGAVYCDDQRQSELRVAAHADAGDRDADVVAEEARHQAAVRSRAAGADHHAVEAQALLERGLDKSRGDKYADYKRRTSAFFPRPPRP